MLNAAPMQDRSQDHWVVSAVADIGGGRWSPFDAEHGALFVLSDGSSTEWPATVSITPVTDEEWTSMGALALDDRPDEPGDEEPGDGRVRLAHRVRPGHAVALFDVGVDATLPGSPIRAEMLIDLTPRLHLVGAAAGGDIYELSRLLDSFAAMLSEVPAGAELGQLGTPGPAAGGA